MKKSTVQTSAVADYVFHFDALPERVTFNRQSEITGWLLHRRGLPTYGIRGIVRGSLRRRSIFKARRKRSRPPIAAAYPDFPEAGQSGFLLALELPAGRSDVTIQVRDQEKIWRTIFVTQIWAWPLAFLGRAGLPRLEHFLVTHLARFFLGKARNIAPSARSELVAQIESPRHGNIETSTGAPGLAEREIKTVHLFVTSKSNLFIREIAELLCAGFRDAGCEAQLFVDQIPAEKTEPGAIQIVVTPHEFYNLFLCYRLPWGRIQRLTNHLFLLGTEQPESDWFHSNLIVAPHARAMLDIHLLGVAAYRARRLRCYHLPLGYHPSLERSDAAAGPERNIDICLLAALTERREAFIADNADFFAARNCHLRLVPIGFAKTEETRSYLSATKRNALLQRSKILLNVHYSDLRYFEWHRMLIGFANRCCIITETCEGFAPFVPGKHFIMAEAEYLTTCCEYYLEHPQEREAIAQAGFDFARAQFSQKDNCLAFLRRLEADSQVKSDSGADSIAEPLPVALTRRISRKTFSLLFSALRDDLADSFRKTERPPVTAGEKITDPVDTADRIAFFSDKRRGYSERFDCQEQMRKNGEPVFRLFENAKFSSNGAPSISIVITLHNYAHFIRQCLQSLEDSQTDTIPGGIEIVIVNDASSDNSLKETIRAQQSSRHPIRIVDKCFNTGLADARNFGLDLARAPYA
ncbi:MAG TPA: glycosyltransferase, partial [Chthoniobacterales bacterium]